MLYKCILICFYWMVTWVSLLLPHNKKNLRQWQTERMQQQQIFMHTFYTRCKMAICRWSNACEVHLTGSRTTGTYRKLLHACTAFSYVLCVCLSVSVFVCMLNISRVGQIYVFIAFVNICRHCNACWIYNAHFYSALHRTYSSMI